MASIVFLEILIFFLATICFVLLRCLGSNKNGLPKNLPIVGMLPELLRNAHRMHDWCTELLDRSSQSTFLFKGPWFANMDMLLTAHPPNMRYVFNTNFSNFHKGPHFKELLNDVFGDGIFNSDIDSWTAQRKVARALLNHQSFHKFMVRTILCKVEKGLLPVLDHVSKQGITVDLQDLFQRFSLDSVCMLAAGYDPGCLSIQFQEVPLFFKAMADMESSLFNRLIVPQRLWNLQKLLGVGKELKLKKSVETVNRTLYEYIERKREELRGGLTMMNEGEQGVDLLTSYMMKEDESITVGLKSDDDKFLRDTLIAFVAAGRDAIDAALTWLFWLVINNPKVETKIREELNSIIPEDKIQTRCLLSDTRKLNKLVYLHGAVCEALRLYPPVPFAHKFPLYPDILPSGHRVTPQTKISMSMYAMGRMKSVWGEDCLEFKPERWISEDGRIGREPSYKFSAFSEGPQNCIGQEVALTLIKAVAVNIIHNYNLQVVEGQSDSPTVSFVFRLKSGLLIRASSRWAE